MAGLTAGVACPSNDKRRPGAAGACRCAESGKTMIPSKRDYSGRARTVSLQGDVGLSTAASTPWLLLHDGVEGRLSCERLVPNSRIFCCTSGSAIT